jgi:hypothetical protein
MSSSSASSSSPQHPRVDGPHERLARYCAEHRVDGVWLRRRANIAWVADGADVHCDLFSELGVASILWTPSSRIVLTDDIEAARLAAEEFGSGWDVRSARWFEPPPEPSGRLATDWPVDAIAPLRFSLSAREVERVRALGREAAEAMQTVMHGVARGASEHEVAADLGASLRRRGILLPVCLVAADERIARFRHPIPTDKRVERVLMAAICAQRQGLIVSLTRLVHFGALDADLRRRHDAVVRVDAALHAATIVGAGFGDVLAAGLRVYAETGFADEWTKHHQGGPMGYAARDFKATPGEARVVEASQLVGWNPSITGTKSEDTILAGPTSSSTHSGPASAELLTRMSDWPDCNAAGSDAASAERPDILVRR